MIECQLRPGESYHLTTVGHCDCGSPLGALANLPQDAGDEEAAVSKLRSKGWSATKIARWQQQKSDQLGARVARERAQMLDRAQPWLDFIEAILVRGGQPYLGLLLHMYDGSVNDGPPYTRRQPVAFVDLDAERLGGMERDVLYEFRAPRA